MNKKNDNVKIALSKKDYKTGCCIIGIKKSPSRNREGPFVLNSDSLQLNQSSLVLLKGVEPALEELPALLNILL